MSLKILFYICFYSCRRVAFSEVRNDTEPNTSYVRVLDPRASEISFVRTNCARTGALYVSCKNLECGVQSVAPPNNHAISLSKMASPGDWPWHVALFRAETHVCDGTLVIQINVVKCFLL